MGGGGAERVLINLLNLLDYEIYSVDFIVLMGKGELWDSIPPMVNKKEANFSPLFIKIIITIFRKTNINLFWLLGGKVRGNYDVGISFMDSVFTELLFIKELKLGKKIAVLHSSYKSYSNRSKFIKGSYKKVICERYRKLDNIIAVANESKQEFIELFGNEYPVEVIYNPLDIKDILNKSTQGVPVELNKEVFNFVAVGSLLPVKDYALLLKASFLLKKNGYNFHLHILGVGELKEKLSSLIEELNLTDLVTLQGFKKNPYTWIKNADVFMMSSIVEGLPTVLCESLILGTPVIVPNVPGCREVIEYGDFGIMCERDENEFFRAMEKCILDPLYVEKYKSKAIERSKIFSDEVAMEKYNYLFQS